MSSNKNVNFSFPGKKVLVTGGTSGIGEAVTLAFCASGANVIFTGRDHKRAESVLANSGSSSGEVRFIPGDLTDAAFCEQLIEQACNKLGGLDIVVNCAGIIFHADAEQTSNDIWHKTMDINVNAVFYVCRAALKIMKQTGGVILNIASDAGLSASGGLTAYNTSKGAVIQMSRSMAKDYGQHNVRVIPICPGDVDTPMLRDEFVQRGMTAKEGLQESAESVPLNRVCTPQEVADLVLYAASDSANFHERIPLGSGRGK